MSRLVIAEKPSVAQSIASVLGAGNRKDGYLEGGGYLVSCVSATWQSFRMPPSITRTMPSGAMRTCRSCRRNGSIRWPPIRKNSLTC